MATMSEYVELQADVERLRKIEAAALRVASSRRDGVVTDVGALDRLDAALEGRAVETPATRVRPNGPEDAQVCIAAAVREIEIICDEFGFDPVQWLMPDLENDMPGDTVSEGGSPNGNS